MLFRSKRLHVLGDVATEDVLLQDLSIELLGLWVVAWEALLVVGDVDTTVGSTLEGTEHTRTSRRALETDVEVALERPGSILVVKGLGHGEGAIGLLLTLVLVGKAKLGQGTASGKETSRVGWRSKSELMSGLREVRRLTSSPVGETVVDAVAGELARAGVGEDEVTLDARVDDLDDDLLVGEANDQAVLGGVAEGRS